MFARLIQQFKAARIVASLERGSIRENSDSVGKLVGIGEPAIGPLLRALDSDDRTTQLESIRALGHIGNDEALDRLAALTRSDDPGVVEAAHRAIGRILKHRDATVRH